MLNIKHQLFIPQKSIFVIGVSLIYLRLGRCLMAYTLPFELKYMLMLTVRSQGQHYQFYRLFAKNTTFGSLVFTPKIIIYGASVIRV